MSYERRDDVRGHAVFYGTRDGKTLAGHGFQTQNGLGNRFVSRVLSAEGSSVTSVFFFFPPHTCNAKRQRLRQWNIGFVAFVRVGTRPRARDGTVVANDRRGDSALTESFRIGPPA